MGNIEKISDADRRSILIVEDDPEMAQLLGIIFRKHGYRTAVAGDGQEALDRVAIGKPDIILLDVMLPDIDGFETYRRIRVLSRSPVVFLTAFFSSEQAARAMRLGISDYIRKPFSVEELLSRIEVLVPNKTADLSNYRRRSWTRKPTVSVIVPTLNEASNLPLVLPYIPLDIVEEVILVDGRSTDGTVEVARQIMPSIQVILEQKSGKGAALRAGYQAAKGDIIIVLDADGSNDPREIPRFIRTLLEGADFAKGSRFAAGGGTTDMPRIRKLGNGVFVKLVNVLFGGSWTDLCYGYHAFWRYCLDVIDLADVDGFEIDTAIYLRAMRERLRIVDLPSFEGYRFTGVGKLNTIPDGWRVLKTIFREWVWVLKAPETSLHLGFRGALPANIQRSSSLQTTIEELHFTENEKELFQRLESAYAINLAESPAIEQARKNLRLLYSSGEKLENGVIGSLLPSILQFTMESIGAAGGSILAMDNQGALIDGCMVHRNQVYPVSTVELSDVMEQGLAGWIIRNRKPVLVPSTLEDPRWLRRSWEEDECVLRSALGVPLTYKDRMVGVLILVHPGAEQFTEDDLDRVAEITQHD